MMTQPKLPPGQQERTDFPRFGLDKYAVRFPDHPDRVAVAIDGDVQIRFTAVASDFHSLQRVEQTSDFHCVTTWSRCGLRWSGFRFADFYERIVAPRARPAAAATFVVLFGQDGYRASLPLEDLLVPDVLLVDWLAGEPLSVAHGAPMRLVAPTHYGYKNAKHLRAIEFWRDARQYRSAGFWFMDHPRARVRFEERGRGLPGWLYRVAYRPLIGPTVRRFQSALDRHIRPASGAQGA